MNTKQKCCCSVFDKSSRKKGRVCRANVWNEFGGKKYCYSHAKKILGESAIILQKHQRAHHCRQILNNIYLKLPLDIQRIIDKYVNEEIYFKRENNIIIKIMHKRLVDIEELISYYNLNSNVPDQLPLTTLSINYSHDIISILTILINNWNNIHLLYNSYLMPHFLVKLFILAKHNIWGTTVWNGLSIKNLTNYLSYISDISPYLHEKNLDFVTIYFAKLEEYYHLFVNTFNYQRTSMTTYRLDFIYRF